jgi:predicted oxidoreductase
MQHKISNQLHPPRPKHRDKVELNKKCTIIKKDGTNTSVTGYGTQNACAVFINSLRENAKKLGIVLQGNYIILGHEVR